MKKMLLGIIIEMLLLGLRANLQGQSSKAEASRDNPVTIEAIKQVIRDGEWISLAVELRPFEDRLGEGKVKPFYVKRFFKYFANDKFEGTIISYADPVGQLPLVKFTFKGRNVWGSEHPVAKGAYAIDYILDDAFEVTPLHPMFADQLNQVAVKGLNKWEVNVMQDIKGKEFPLFGIKAGDIVSDYDLIYIHNKMLFMGSKHVDGRGFDKPENRPTNLQIPLERK